MKLLKIDDQGYFIEDVILDKRPTVTVEEEVTDENGITDTVLVQVPDPHYITTPCPGGFYTPRWDGEKWVEGKAQEEIDAIKAEQEAIANQPTQEDYLLDLDYRLTIQELGL